MARTSNRSNVDNMNTERNGLDRFDEQRSVSPINALENSRTPVQVSYEEDPLLHAEGRGYRPSEVHIMKEYLNDPDWYYACVATKDVEYFEKELFYQKVTPEEVMNSGREYFKHPTAPEEFVWMKLATKWKAARDAKALRALYQKRGYMPNPMDRGTEVSEKGDDSLALSVARTRKHDYDSLPTEFEVIESSRTVKKY